MVKRTVFLVAVLAAVGLTFAQEQKPVSLGIRAGFNLASLSISDDREESSGSYSYSRTSNITTLTGNLIGFHAGAVIDIALLEFLYFQPGVMFSLKGGSMENESKEVRNGNSRSSKSTTTIAPYYIDLPINFSLKGNLANDLALRAHIGPYIGFGLFGEMEGKSTNSEYPEDNSSQKAKLFSKEKNCYDDGDGEVCGERATMLGRFNFGIGFGVGIDFGDFYLGVNYNYGLANLFSKDMEERGKLYERTLGIMLGYNL
jgi:hypothetical protein